MITLPPPRTADPAAAPTLRWGVIGPGWIAQRFVDAVQHHTRQHVLAVASRQLERATEFADRHHIPRAYGSYEHLLADPDIDVVYIATPHNAHAPCARQAIAAGKHTLVEKPLALNAAEAAELRDLAHAQQVFLGEALWTLFLPKYDVIRQLLDEHALGDVHTVFADYGDRYEPGHRILRADLAGGPLLDLGTYPAAFTVFALGRPDHIAAVGTHHPAGVNGQASAVLHYPSGAHALINTTLTNQTPSTATISGEIGVLHLPAPFFQPGPMTLTGADGRVLTYDEPAIAHEAVFYEAAETARCIAAGRLETPIRPVADSIATLQVMDEIRRQIGVVFDEEQPASTTDHVPAPPDDPAEPTPASPIKETRP